MTALLELWEVPSFKAAMLALIDLDSENRNELLHYAAESIEPPPIVGDASLSQARIMGAQVLATLARVALNEGREPVQDDLREILEDSSSIEYIEDALAQLSTTSPAEHESRIYRHAQTSTLPIVQKIDLVLDFRTVSRDEAGTPALVPVVIARLEFDEPVGGSRALEFQIPDPSLQNLESELPRLRALGRSTMEQIPPELVIRGDSAWDGAN